MSTYNVVAASNESTVVTEYEPQSKRSDAYQSEAALEQAFIKMLEEQGYAYLPIHDNADLVANLRRQLELLNNYTFTDKEWDFFFKDKIANANDGIKEKTRRIQEDNIQNLTREDGSTVNITLLDKKNIHNNRLQVINQYVENSGNYNNRYDVTILVNGLPLVHVELKRRGVPIKEAFNQINRYQRDSFWAGSGLYEYVQIFVISNGTNTKYYSNTTRDSHIKESAGTTRKSSKKTSNSFEFTSFWADGKNRVIPDLVDFTRTFFARHTLLNILTKYCVFTSEDLLLVMRPYQIAATERILSRIEVSTNYKQTGTLAAGGYIWHTTGSGKTLTSFKTAQLASNLPYIDKVLFVVDRKDLDYQTMKEYDRFEKGAANGNTSTQVLQRQLEDRDAKGNPHTYKIIITTIQKLALFVSRNKGHEIFQKHVVLIFDECHRSQFGDMHEDIVKYFKNYHLFGFTGTPIFAANAGTRGKPTLKTTPQAFGGEPDADGKKVLPLHTYTIVDAINDNNVLPFRIDYVDTVNRKAGIGDKQVKAIDTEKALADPRRVKEIVKYILEHFDQKTKRNGKTYSFRALRNIEAVATDKTRGQVAEVKDSVRLSGFNSIFAVSSIAMAKAYYLEFKRQMQDYQSNYIDLYQQLRPKNPDKEVINDDIVFEMELIRQVEINIDYILMLVAKYHDSNCEDKEILVDIRKAVDSSMQLRSKKDLIENFIATVNTATKVDDDWIKFVTEQKKTDLDTLIAEEKLKPDETRKFVDNSFRDGILKTTGTDVDRILPPVSRFGGGNRAAKKDGIIAKLQAFFDKYFGLI
jgi:type I restriction enzyme R subunit